MRRTNCLFPPFALALAIGLTGCGTLDLIGHASIHNDAAFPSREPESGSMVQPREDPESAFIVEVDGKPAQSEPLPTLYDCGPHIAAWVRAGKHLFKIQVTSAVVHEGVTNPVKYITFSATVRSETRYVLGVVNDQPMLIELKSGSTRNESIPLTVVSGP